MKDFQPHFVGKLELTPLPDGRNWKLAHAFEFFCPGIGVIIVPKDFETDLASIPQIFWNILPPFGKYTEAAVIHDYVYRTHRYTRAQCDKLLLKGMRVCKVPRWQRAVIYLAVRIFGGKAWNDDARRFGAEDREWVGRYGGRHFLSRDE